MQGTGSRKEGSWKARMLQISGQEGERFVSKTGKVRIQVGAILSNEYW